MEGRQERVEPLDRSYELSSLGGEVEAVARGDRSMQQCRCLWQGGRAPCQMTRLAEGAGGRRWTLACYMPSGSTGGSYVYALVGNVASLSCSPSNASCSPPGERRRASSRIFGH
jgi:hypothetical protein